MKVRGWIYVITNKAMPGLVKIGYSTKDPFLRAKEFDGTGTPHPYNVIYDALVLEPREIEQKVHSILKDKREGKEWFRCSIKDSIKAIRSASIDRQIIETTDHQIIGLMNQEIIETSEKEKTGRFVVYDDGTVLDIVTNLMWANKSIGDGISWSSAQSHCENYRGGGYMDWRMPTLDEMDGLNKIDNVGDVIKITKWFLWASERRIVEAATFDVRNAERLWLLQSLDTYHGVLPVRSCK
ncbi:MAG: GIY-YIG nuclease family protein [Anaerolineaceae bacterium]